MAKKFTSTYTIVFVAVVSVICGLLLSVAASALRSRIDDNRRLDVKKNILVCFNAYGSGDLPERKQASAAAVNGFFTKRVQAIIVNPAGEEISSAGIEVAELKPWITLADPAIDRAAVKLPVYILKAAAGDQVEAYCIPIWGKGLWGSIYGYLAIEPDGQTVRGITFLSNHQETPGLGARIEEAEWQGKWKEKTIFEGDRLTPITLIKGGVRPDSKSQAHEVDGISGATMTGNGVTAMLKNCLTLYEPFLRQVRAKAKGN